VLVYSRVVSIDPACLIVGCLKEISNIEARSRLQRVGELRVIAISRLSIY
jgi:hypothetical protein